MIKRDIFKPIIEHLEEKEITVIIGPRQVGKTTILDQVEKFLINKKNIAKKYIFRFNLDIITDRKLFENQADVINFIRSRQEDNQKIYFFIDEVQRIKNAGSFIKGIYDLNLGVKLILTGSSSLEIKAKIQEALTGRKKIFQVLPLTINEYFRYINIELFNIIRQGEKLLDYDFEKVKNILNTFCIFGGYPRVAIETNINKKVEIIEELYNSYLDKDVVGFLKIKKINSFNKLVSLLSSQVGNLLNVNKLASEVGVEVATLREYLNILENTFVISLIRPFFTNTKKELVKAPKLFFIDNGLRNFSISRFENLDERIDKGAVFENAVATELIKNIKTPDSLYYWRTLQKAEVDFVIRKGDGNLIPLEIKAQSMKEIALSRSYYSFLKKYSPKKAYLINFNLREQEKIKNISIDAKTIFDIDSIVKR